MLKCSICNSTNTIKKGNISIYKKRILCKDCGKWSTITITHEDETNVDFDIINENMRLKKELQKTQDRNRIERKSWRAESRVDNVIQELNVEMINLLKTHSFKHDAIRKIDKVNINNKKVGIVQLSDLHFLEKIDLPNNKYDMSIACKRLKLFANEIINQFTNESIDNIVIVMSGDLINNDLLADKILSNTSNRTAGMFSSSYIINQFIHELSEHFYNIICFSVIGNESRVNHSKTVEMCDFSITHNYDYAIHNILSILNKDNKNINFVFGNDQLESIIKVLDTNILITHGFQFKANPNENIKNIIKKYSMNRNQNIDLILCGHYHENLTIGNIFARSGSLCGNNKYSESLGLSANASQNIIIIEEKNRKKIINIDLQDVSNVNNEYEYKKELEKYESVYSKDKIDTSNFNFQILI